MRVKENNNQINNNQALLKNKFHRAKALIPRKIAIPLRKLKTCLNLVFFKKLNSNLNNEKLIDKYFLIDAAYIQAPVKPHNSSLSTDEYYNLGCLAYSQMNEDAAFEFFASAIALTRHEPSMDKMRDMSQLYFSRAKDLSGTENPLIVRDSLVRAVELDPSNHIAREYLHDLLIHYAEPDLTKKCFIFYDGERALKIHTEAYKRALEYVTIGGVVGDILEFGVLGGWSSRIFCELMRDLRNFSNIHLFDSFEGLPEYASNVDISSWEIQGRKIWQDKMKFPEDFLKQFITAHDKHIKTRLSEIIRKERIFIHKGFYSDTLKTDIPFKAAIVHIDCDLYQSTSEVLWGLYRMKAYQDGCVLLFDDWNCNRASPRQGERLAFQEFLDSQVDFEASSWFSYSYNGMAFILHQK